MLGIGTIIGDRYEILGKVGSGGMADVFRAKDNRLNRFVAIKILKQEYSEDTKFVARFRGEAQAIAAISHPNIVAIYDVGEYMAGVDNTMYYIVMEMVEGITLKKYIEEKKRLGVREAVGISIQIANGLEAAHNNNIIHRDIKPQNILMARDGTAKVTDFGIAKAASSNTITANTMGSVHYISPEQARGGYSDMKSDIYSLGVTMYEMLSGTLPFTGESAVAVALSHLQEDAMGLHDIDPNLPVGLCNIVNKCMQKKTELRYSSAEELIDELKMFLQNPDGNYGIIKPLYEDGGTIEMSKEDLDRLKGASRENKVNVTPIVDKKNKKKIEDEDDKNSDVDPKLEKALVFGSVAVAIIIGLIIIYTFGRFIGWWGNSSSEDQNPGTTTQQEATPTPAGQEQYVIEDFANQPKEKVTFALEQEEIKYTIEEQPSDDVEKGNVIGTNPAAGSSVVRGTTIEVYVSTGIEQISVPDTTGLTITDAITKLQKKGFSVKQGDDVYSNQESGKVAYTKPGAGEKTDKGATITIYQSKGVETKYATVPSLIGMTRSQAKAALSNVKLKYGSETRNYSSTKKNRVCVQSVAAGKQVEEGTAVDVTLSLGEETTYRYVGQVSGGISNPFEYETDDAATIKIVLTQDGKQTTLIENTMSYHDFPYPLTNIEGTSANQGTVTVYKDGEKVGVYSASFKRVAE